MSTNKDYKMPEFKVMRFGQTNAKFFTASGGGFANSTTSTAPPAVTSMNVGNASQWF